MSVFKTVCKDIIRKALQAKVQTVGQLNNVKMKVLRNYPQITTIPNNADLLMSSTKIQKEKLNHLLLMKPMRTISGVSPIALMTDPYPCPHTLKGIGPCSYCPGGPGSPFGDVPQSYTGEEPSTRRAMRNNYDPYLGVFNRLEHYLVMNHTPEKVEIILQGGTFPFTPKIYQDYFVKYLFKAMNDFSKVFYSKGKLNLKRFTSFFELPAVEKSGDRTKNIHRRCLLLKNLDLDNKPLFKELMTILFSKKNIIDQNIETKNKHIQQTFQNIVNPQSPVNVSGPNANVISMKKVLQKTKEQDRGISLEKEQTRNETSQIRCVGLTIETKSDYGKLEHGNDMLRLGCTRVELGIQTIYDDVLKNTNRGNTVADNIESMRILKDLGFKINAHVMPGLPGVTQEKDKKALKTLFTDQKYRPDMLKIYPCMVLEGTKLFEDYKKGKFKPMTTPQAAKMIAWFMQFIPPYCRVHRVQRDIPTFMTESGVDKTNLRQYVEQEMKKQHIVSRDIRAREPGHSLNKTTAKPQLSLDVIDYEASNGREFFIQMEDKQTDMLYGYARLRFPSDCLREEITPTSALLRELHVFGAVATLGEKGNIQHKGIGKQLLSKAEEICIKHNKNKLVIISGVGVREYYKKQGYQREGMYMVKIMKPKNKPN